MYVIGVDGGGSSLRVIIATAGLDVISWSEGGSANPSVVGRERASATIRQAVTAAIQGAGVEAREIAAVGIGVAGAAASHSSAWLREVVAGVLPGIPVVPSADYEIALVGAHGKREGILALAGTGSLAYGVNASGIAALAGGWGYLLGDEGGGYWLGREGLRAVMLAADGQGAPTSLSEALLEGLGVAGARHLIQRLYGAAVVPVAEIAGLAPLVLQEAGAGDAVALEIVERGARELALKVETVARNLDIAGFAVAFSGGLLSERNPMSIALRRCLSLSEIPSPKYPPVLGAALMALSALGEIGTSC